MVVHRVHNGERFHPHAHVAYQLSAFLKALFNDNSGADQRGARAVDQLDQALERTAVSEKVVNDQYFILRR